MSILLLKASLCSETSQIDEFNLIGLEHDERNRTIREHPEKKEYLIERVMYLFFIQTKGDMSLNSSDLTGFFKNRYRLSFILTFAQRNRETFFGQYRSC